ncbi:hypothetical protein FQR65_LT14583 [Abscondita terminalis]|nr:hypothetical protein FQR65_LT14583 [Abscondita terminalis]
MESLTEGFNITAPWVNNFINFLRDFKKDWILQYKDIINEGTAKPNVLGAARFEAISVEIRIISNKQNLNVIVVYFSPQSDINDFSQFCDILEMNIQLIYSYNVLIGDFNLPEVDNLNYDLSLGSVKARRLEHLVSLLGFKAI